MFCANCQAIQPPVGTTNHFAALSVAAGFDLDVAALETGYKDLTKRTHPDRFARADVRARRAATEWSVRINQAWRTLRDPVSRAEYLLAGQGIDVGGEEGERVPVPQNLLMEVMELREQLQDARAGGHEATVAALAGDVRGRRAARMERVAQALRATAMDLNAAADALVAVRYYDRFLDEAQTDG